jgi:ADP-heptose:LPS heptosyltransferase
MLVLGPADDSCEALAHERGAVVVREPSIGELGALLSRAGLFVGNDSGVSHLAAAYGAPTVALFGPTDPTVWSPVGPRVRTLRAPDQRMESMRIEEVEKAIDELRKK